MNIKKPDVEQNGSRKPKILQKKKTVKWLIVLFVVGLMFFVAYFIGFIPITEFMSIKKPIGESKELNINEYLEEFPGLADIPNLDKIKYSAYGTDEPIDNVIDDYTKKLEDEGYSLKYKGIGSSEGKSFQYYGFLKGLTAVGIIVSSDAKEDADYKSVVFYSTGNALDFREILDWYTNNK